MMIDTTNLDMQIKEFEKITKNKNKFNLNLKKLKIRKIAEFWQGIKFKVKVKLFYLKDDKKYQ